ncbi:MAG TPA: hypothetical protein V6C65_12000, partial [Allocoleopsis sp.]
MKKWLIGSIVGAILVFAWQALSHTMLPIHANDYKYSSSQNEVLSALSAGLKEEGAYLLPSAPTMKEQMEVMKNNKGKPWAMVMYHTSLDTDMVTPMIRGFLVDLFLVISLMYVLTRGGTPIGRRIFSGSVAWGLAFFLWGPYMGRIWYQLPWHM